MLYDWIRELVLPVDLPYAVMDDGGTHVLVEMMRRMDLTETLEPKVCSLSGLGVDLVPLIHRYKNPMKMK